MFIVLEGIDGCGKTTQAALLAEWLTIQGYNVHLTAEPSEGKIGKFIREEILSGKQKTEPETLALLFTADRYEHLVSEIMPALSEGKIVVCERYYYSTIAYQAAQGVDKTWLFEINKFAAKPNLVIFLDINPKKALSRKQGGEIFENQKFLEKVYTHYIQFVDIHRVDSSKEPRIVFEKIRDIVSRVLK